MSRPECCNHDCNSGRECPLRQPREIGLWLEWAIIGVLVVVFLLAISGCDKRPEIQAAEQQQAVDAGYVVHAFTDRATGCEYLLYERGGIAPRVAADGKSHMGCKGEKHE